MSRILAQLIITGGGMFIRAAVQAYQQALVNGQRAGGAEALKKAAGRAQMTLDEARQILGIEPGATWELIEKKYSHLFKANSATSHYLLSKVYRAKERIDQEFPDEAKQWSDVHGDSTESARKAAKEAQGSTKSTKQKREDS